MPKIFAAGAPPFRNSGACNWLILTIGLVVAIPLLPLRPASAQTAPASTDAAPAQPDAPTGFWDRDTLTGDWGGLRTSLEDRGIKFSLQEQSELWGNLSGGLRTGATYDGLTTASLKLDLDKLAGIANTVFFVSALQIHGRGPSANLVGNLQLVSNIEATRDTKLYDMWLETALFSGRLHVRIGQEGVNDELMSPQYATLFLNSSFGFPALTATDLPSGGPNYPLATPFVSARLNLGGGFTLVGGVFNGDPAPSGTGDPQLRDGGGTAFRLDGHALVVAELWFSPDPGHEALPTTYKLGAWFHSGGFADPLHDASGLSLANPASSGVARRHSHDEGFYGIVDQTVWRRTGTEDQGIGLFLEVMVAPDDRNLSNLFIEAGLNWKAPIPGRDNDSFGLAATYEGISPSARRYSMDLAAVMPGSPVYASNETCIELTYLYQATPWLALQPDVQYVVNPGANIPVGTHFRVLKDDLVAGVRATITF